MGWNVGIPSLKLNNVGKKSKHCGSFAGVAMEALEERKGRDPDIDPELAHLNIYEGITSARELMKYSQKHVQELSDQQRAAGGRKIRDDAVVMCSTIIKPPAAMMATLSREDQIRFLRDALEKLDEIIGPENGRSVAIHFDEEGAHLHRLWEPMTEDGRLCAKERHNIKFFGRLNREMPEHLRSRGWDIDDCQAYDAAKDELEQNEERKERKKKSGRSSAVYKQEMEQKVKSLENEVGQLQEQLDQVQEQLDQTQGQLDQVQEQLGQTEEKLQQQRKRYDEICATNEANLKVAEKNEETIEAQREILQLIQDYDEYRAEAAQIEQDLDLMEETYNALPASKKLFHQAAASTWLERMTRILQDIRRLIEAGIRRLKIFEKDFGVEEPLSVPVERRKLSLDAKIFGAEKKAQEAAKNAPGAKKEGASWG